MAYFKVKKSGAASAVDLSGYVSGLKISTTANYNAQQNAAGDTRVDYINEKKTIEVTIIPLTDSGMNTLLASIGFVNDVTYREAGSGNLVTLTNCICDQNEIEYNNLTINRKYKEMVLTFTQL